MPHLQATAPPPRYYGVPHLLAASLFGGAAACCTLLGRNERLRAVPKLPWDSLAWLYAMAEAGLIVACVLWQWQLARLEFAALFLAPIVVLCLVTHFRYREQRRQFRPALGQQAVEVGWVFCALRVTVFLAAAWYRTNHV
ncbi:MAG: hypothetical protein MUC36_12660 [Planctomycetes bacterium]|nr:hypothetical protein [Planctomycetota bacterium]